MFEEFKVWIHVAIGVVLVAASAGSAWKLTSDHYEDVILRTQHEKDTAVQTQMGKTIEAQQNQKAAEEAVQVEHEQHLKDSAILAGQLTSSLRDLEVARARLGALSPAVVDPGKPAAAATWPGSASAVEEGRRRLEEAIRLFDAARDNAIDACGFDSIELGSILDLQARQEQPAEVGETK